MKPNNSLLYINKQSNHPPATLKNIPSNINNRLSRNSANEDIFNAASEPYQQALETSGYDFKLKFDPSVKVQQQQQQKKKRSRRITWFNPPFSLNVKRNVGAIFLQIIKDCFPKDGKVGGLLVLPRACSSSERHGHRVGLCHRLRQENTIYE